MDDNGNGQKSGMPKLFEIYRRQRQDSDASMTECPDIDFTYADTDSYENEMSELYSYSEGTEFQLNLKAFESVCSEAGVLALWQSMTQHQRSSLLVSITDQMELCDSDRRALASRALLYIAQGCWGEVQCDQEQVPWVRANCFTLLQCNAWSSCLQLLNIEIQSWVSIDNNSNNNSTPSNNKQQQQQQQSGSHVSLASSSQLRVLLSVLYTLVETLRWPSDGDTEDQCDLREAFCADLALPQEETDELLAVTLLGMVTRFCNSSPPHFPIRKLLLLLWKLLLVTLGGAQTLRTLKAEYREGAGLPPRVEDDTVTVCRGLRPASPPAPASDLLDQQQQHNMVRRRPFRRSLMKQSSLDDSMGDLDLTADDDPNTQQGGGGSVGGDDGQGVDDDSNNSSGEDSGIGEGRRCSEGKEVEGVDDEEEGGAGVEGTTVIPTTTTSDVINKDDIDDERAGSPRPPTPSAPHTPPPPPPHTKALPWTPKVRQKDIDSFLDVSREKFVGFQLPGDRTTLAGLPTPIHEGVHTLEKHIYTSLSEIQMKREDEIRSLPLSRPEVDVPETPAELLYQSLLPTLPQCMIALLKVLLAAAPTSKAKTDSINIMADVLPQEMPLTVVQSMKLGLDVNRHKEVLVKAVSASLLLLLKHLKLNHVYQFEFMSQHLVFANCIPLILKFFNQNIMAYVQAKNTIALLDFPSCVIGDGADLSNDALLACIGAAAAAAAGDECKSLDGGNNLLNDSSSPIINSNPSTPTIAITTTTNTISNSCGGNNNMNATTTTGGGGTPTTAGGAGTTNNNNGMSSSNSNLCCWRNMFSCINLLRVLNKLCKWKHSRIMMLVVFKSAPILKRTLMVKHSMMQLYVLKLLKMQTKYLGRQWRKSNMKTLSAIYQMVRHRLNDDWAYGNDPDARPWDFQTEECSLRAAVDRFNTRRYHQPVPGDNELEPVDNCITSVLGRQVELTEEFMRCYEVWLQREVLNTTIHWDLLLSTNTNHSNNIGSPTNCSNNYNNKELCNKCKQANKSKSSSNSNGGGDATNVQQVLGCECKKLVTDATSHEDDGYYTPLIQQLTGYTGDKQDDKRKFVEDDDEEEEDEFDKKERMQTMVKKSSTSNGSSVGSASSIISSSAAPVAVVVDISIEDDNEKDANKIDQPMDVDKK